MLAKKSSSNQSEQELEEASWQSHCFLYIKCSAPTKHATVITEWHLNGVSIAYYLFRTSKWGEKKDETSILPKGSSTLQMDSKD